MAYSTDLPVGGVGHEVGEGHVCGGGGGGGEAGPARLDGGVESVCLAFLSNNL